MDKKEILGVISKRASVRAFDSSKTVSRDQIEAILEAACSAPSAMNTQPWRFYIAETADEKRNVMDAMSAHNAWANEAYAFIILLADLRTAYNPNERKYYIDIGLCLENLLLEAVNQGLAACPCSAFDSDKLYKLLNIPEHLEPLIIVPIGYEANGNTLEKLRKKYGSVIERSMHKRGGRNSIDKCIIKWA